MAHIKMGCVQKCSHLGPCLYLGPTVQEQPYHDDVAPAGSYVQGSDPILPGGMTVCQKEQPLLFQGGKGQTKERGQGELYLCPGTMQGNSLFNRAVREGCAAKGCRQKLHRACRKASAHGLGCTRGSGRGILTAGSMSSALQQQHQLSLSLDTRSSRTFGDAWLLLIEGRHSRKGPCWLLVATPPASVLLSAWSHLTSIPWQLLQHPTWIEGTASSSGAGATQAPAASHSALTWGVKLTLAPRFSSNWATLRFS